MNEAGINPRRFYGGLFCITMATMMLQIIQVRILSVVIWYHLAFFVISAAMYGLTLGAVWVYLKRERFSAATLGYDLTVFSAAFALSIAVSLAVQMTLSPIEAPGLTSLVIWLELMICLSVPFVFSGIVVSLALTRSPYPVGRVYGVDLAGAAAGCLGVVAVLNFTDGPTSVIMVAALASIGALLFAGSGVGGMPDAPARALVFLHRHRRSLLLLLVAGVLINHFLPGNLRLRPVFVKTVIETRNTAPEFERWNSFSRITVHSRPNRVPHMWGPSPTFDPEPWLIDQRLLSIDGLTDTTAYRLAGDLALAGFLKYDITNLAYHLPGLKRALIIGGGAGRDMLSARVFDVPDVTGLEINPILVDLQTREPGFHDFTDLGRIPGIRLVNDEARSWIARDRSRYDLIQMSLIDTWAATGAGAYTLTENGLYTVEAWRLILQHLTPGGVFTVSRWYNPGFVMEAGRIVSLAVAALLAEGAENPDQHVFMATTGRVATLIISRQPMSRDAVASLEEAVSNLEFERALSPGREVASNILAKILAAPDLKNLEVRTRGLALDLTPPTDDRPFFFNQLPLLDVPKVIGQLVSGHGPGVASGNLFATYTLFMVFLLSLVLVAATIVLPLKRAVHELGSRPAFAGTAYFALIGIGFMAAEIALLQRFSVFLGHPAFALSIVLFSLVLAAGGGSLLSEKYRLKSPHRFVFWSVVTGIYMIALPMWLPDVTSAFAEAGLGVRALVSIAIVAPVGILTGFGFPTGMRLISALDARPTPWYWGINGATGVLATTLAIATSISFGISATLILAGLCYLLLTFVVFGIGFRE